MSNAVDLQIEIIYEDDDLMVLAKPAGVVVNEADTVMGKTIQRWCADYLAGQPTMPNEKWQVLVPSEFDESYGSPEAIFAERQGMVHRLDKNTSGVLVWAKNPGSLVNLLAQFRDRQVEKTYTCLVHGYVRPERGELDFPLGRASKNRKKFAVVADGRPALTQYRVVQQYAKLDEQVLANDRAAQQQAERIYQGFSLVECFPKTGRTHQIRVHLAHIMHPLVGDVTYVGKKRAKLDPVWCPRHFLHASTLKLRHPRTGKQLIVEVSLADDLQAVLAKLV